MLRRKLRVLVVDDDPDTRETVTDLVTLLGHECDSAGSGAEALEVLERFEPHVILLDLGLPDISGHDVARTIRASRCSDITIVAISGRSEVADRARSKESGIDLHLVKPVGAETLGQVLGDSFSPKDCKTPWRRSGLTGFTR